MPLSFCFGDLAALGHRHLADEGALARLLGARLDAGGLLQIEAGRSRLHLEGEGLVLEGGDDHRNRRARLHLLRGGIEGLAEFHDVQAALTERGADGRRRICLSRRHLQLDVADDFLSHYVSLAGRPGR